MPSAKDVLFDWIKRVFVVGSGLPKITADPVQ
jgi:hypothetical protein